MPVVGFIIGFKVLDFGFRVLDWVLDWVFVWFWVLDWVLVWVLDFAHKKTDNFWLPVLVVKNCYSYFFNTSSDSLMYLLVGSNANAFSKYPFAFTLSEIA